MRVAETQSLAEEWVEIRAWRWVEGEVEDGEDGEGGQGKRRKPSRR